MNAARARSEHGLRRLVGRDPGESHRPATPLELFFDLTFVVGFSQLGAQAAHLLELGHFATAVGAFAFAAFALCWAWINYSFLASGYDNDDVFFRIATLVQMIGVLVLALGIPPIFHSIDEGEHLDNGVGIAGYVIMRVSAVALWLKITHDDPVHRRTALTYAGFIGIAQLGWVATIIARPTMPVMIVILILGLALEILGPYLVERKPNATPWHPHHLAERYGLLVIITLGEVILGTILAISAVVEEQGWSFDAGAVAFGGTALAFGLWWIYFTIPSGDLLARFRTRALPWSYGHIVIFSALAATGAGLHVAAQSISGEAHIGPVEALATIVIPVVVFLTALFAVYTYLAGRFDPFHVVLFLGSLAVLAISMIAVGAGASLPVGILIVAAAPVVVVVGYETVGHRHQRRVLEELVN